MLRAVAYSDVFDYPLTAREVHRYLPDVTVSPEIVSEFLAGDSIARSGLSRSNGFFTLPDREAILETRIKREMAARRLWPTAIGYGRLIAGLPYVRMVGITGELAVDNVTERSDIDYFLVVEPGRLWLTRAMVILIVKAAARRGVTICPNYLVTENALRIDQRNLYTAREMAQMIPLAGTHVYDRFRRINNWVMEYLPNASGSPRRVDLRAPRCMTPRVSEAILNSSVGDGLERWEMNRKIRKFTRESPDAGEAAFSADWCKGHFDAHGKQTLSAYAERLQLVEDLLT